MLQQQEEEFDIYRFDGFYLIVIVINILFCASKIIDHDGRTFTKNNGDNGSRKYI